MTRLDQEKRKRDKRRKIKSLGEGTSDACHVIESRKMDSENSSCSFDKVEKVLLYCLAGKHIKSSWHSFEMNMFFSSNTVFSNFLTIKKSSTDKRFLAFAKNLLIINNLWSVEISNFKNFLETRRYPK